MNTIVIAAISSRCYVQVAVEAGFDVIAIDAFCDVDTQKLAKKVIQVDVINGQFDAEQLLFVLNQLDLNNCIGLSYGAGFEAQSHLLNQIDLILPVIGNSAEVVQQCKQPQLFFALCDACNIPYPETVFIQPLNAQGWLQKTVGASGGEHIKPVFSLDLESLERKYFQRKQDGISISCLFLSDGQNAQVLGFNEQWCSPTELSPFRLGGLASQTTLSEAIRNQLTKCVQLMAKKLALRGLNSGDFLVENDEILMLEINPRLSASVSLYQTKHGNLFASHVAACLGQLTSWPAVIKQSRALQVIYVNQITNISADMIWPEWVCDVPQPNSVIPVGVPICSVVAKERTAKLAKQKVLERAASL